MIVLAHGLGGRSDLPIPLWMALYGGAAAVIVSFVALGVLWTEPRLKGVDGGKPWPIGSQRLADSQGVRIFLRALGVMFLAVTLATVVLGEPSVATNPAPTWFYVWFWVGLVPASLLLGPIWKLVNPLRAISSMLSLDGGQDERYPERWGYIPAGISLLIFLWLELVFDRGSEPFVIGVFILGYSVVHVIGGIVYGQGWFARADGFEVYSTLISHLSPFGRRSDGRLVVRNPLHGLDAIRPERGLVFVTCVLLGSTAFDGITRTVWWEGISKISDGQAYYLLSGTAGLAGAVALVYVIYMAATRVVAGMAEGGDAYSLDLRLVHSLVPIALGYTVAHYFSLFVFQGQAGYILASDPFAKGWDLFGTAEWRIDHRAVSVSAIAWVQVLAIVLGHVAGVVAAHDRAVRLFSKQVQAKAQYPLLGAMIAFTLGGIFLLVGT